MCTYRSASCRIRTDGRVPGVTGIAVRVSARSVYPAPVGVEDDRPGLRRAATARCTLLDCQRGVRLSRERAGLLSMHDCKEGEGDESDRAEHPRRGLF